MKTLLILIGITLTSTSHAYRTWRHYTPHNAAFNQTLFGNLVIHTNGMINSCSGLFEGNRFRTKVVSCDGDALRLEVEYKNHVDCDQGMSFDKRLVVKLSKECKNAFFEKVVINNREFSLY
jgi:hypothetical protein